jgi:putative phosphonate metabolism protein
MSWLIWCMARSAMNGLVHQQPAQRAGVPSRDACHAADAVTLLSPHLAIRLPPRGWLRQDGTMTTRYAIYAMPEPGDPLWTFGSLVLGRDALSGAAVPHPPALLEAIPDWAMLVTDPRRYGFHGTLKPPFRLADGVTARDILAAARSFSAARQPFATPPLRVTRLGAFCALTPSAPCAPLDALAADCVRAFEPMRAPLTQAEREKRLRSPLTPRQHANLDEWGYPYVFEDFRFHLTLSDALPEERREAVAAALEALYAPLAGPLHVSGIALFEQQDGGDFRVTEWLPFGR